MNNCQKCHQTWCNYRGTDGSLVYNCQMFLEFAPTTSDGTYLSQSVASKTEVPIATKLSDVELLTEFKRRFKGSVLYNVNIAELLFIIGEQHLNQFLNNKMEEE